METVVWDGKTRAIDAPGSGRGVAIGVAGAPVTVAACPCCQQARWTEGTARMGSALRWWGQDRFRISSWYRCERHNAKVGGAEKSQHLTGNAIDVVGDVDSLLWLALHVMKDGKEFPRGIIWVNEPLHLHLDWRSERFWAEKGASGYRRLDRRVERWQKEMETIRTGTDG